MGLEVEMREVESEVRYRVDSYMYSGREDCHQFPHVCKH